MSKPKTLNILFVGDIVAKLGRKATVSVLPKLKKDLNIDFVFANCENIAHGSGVTKPSLDEILSAGVDFCTSGNHIFKNPVHLKEIFKNYPVIRPANYPDGVMGDGYKIIEHGPIKILIINLIGRVFMKGDFDCPFRKFDEIYKKASKKKFDCVVVDFHAETTSEKKALFEYIRNRVDIFVGTHTHIGTADYEIIDGSAYISDIGMVGAKNSSLGVDLKNVIREFLYQVSEKHEFAEFGEFLFNSVLIKYDVLKKKCIKIERVDKIGEVKNNCVSK